MNAAFIISLAGVDSPNLVQKLAKFTHQQQGIWLSSRINYLDGHIAANIKVESPAESKQAIIDYFTGLEKMSCYVEDVIAEQNSPAKTIHLTVKATDRSGLVSDITHIIDQQKAEIKHIENHRYSVPPLGTTVFTSDLEVCIAENSSVADLVAELKTISDDIIINS